MWKRAAFIGRFQPFHKGHLYSLRKALTKVDKIVIGIGSANISDEENPLNYQQRLYMLNKMVKREGMGQYIDGVVRLNDFPSDDDWIREVKNNMGECDVVVGNNRWTNKVLKGEGYEVYETGHYNRDELEGEKIRELFRDGSDDWKERLPAYLVADFKLMMKVSKGVSQD